MASHKRRSLASLFRASLLLVLAMGSLISKANADATSRLEGFYDQTYEISGNRLSYSQGFQDSSWSGAYVFSLPLNVPPGRNGLQPSLALSYNSQSRNLDSFYGYGWSLDMPYISRLNKTGLNNLYDETYFSSSLSGELVAVSGNPYGEYASKVDQGDFLIYEFNSDDSWTVTDKSGTEYSFGSSTDSRQDDQSDSTHIYKWMLEEIRDSNDNYISYTYYKEGGQIYPESITYTGHGSTDGPFTVEFTLESRSDALPSFQTGFEVQTDYRVNEITIKIAGAWRRKYELAYTTPDNTSISLLESVTESAQNEAGATVTLAPTSFEYAESDKGWTSASGYTIPVYFYSSGSNDDKGLEVADVNGDSFVDLINSFEDSGRTTQKVYTNGGDGTGWFEDSSYTIPISFWSSGNLMKNARTADVNGDGFMDLLYGTSGTEILYKYDEDSQTWLEDSDYSLPVDFNQGYLTDQGVRLLDMNGDDYPDFVQALTMSGTTSTPKNIYLFDPSTESWSSVSGVSIPVYFNDQGGDSDEGVELGDVNGDGLVDIVESRYTGRTTQGVYLNLGDGTGWVQDTGYSIPIEFWQSSDIMMPTARLIDVDGDGLADIVHSSTGGSTNNAVYINQGDGTGWKKDSSYSVPVSFANGYLGYQGVQIFDLNGDGFSDFVQSKYDSGSTQKVYLNNATPELLTSIKHFKGATSTISYAPSTEWDNPELPFVMDLVSEITVEDGLGGSSTTTYSYEGGAYLYEDEFDRQFAGFSSITKTEEGRVTETFYHQDNLAKSGKAYQVDISDESGNVYKRLIDTWETSDLGYENDFVYKSQSLNMSYGGSTSHEDSAETYEYDSYGNLEKSAYYGEVSGKTDGSFTDSTGNEAPYSVELTYATDSSGLIRNKVALEVFKDEDGTTIRQTRYYYDGLAIYSVSTGNLSAESHWEDTTNKWLLTAYTVNSYGLVEAIKNPRGYTTQITYDSYYLYPATTTNPLSHTISASYDYASGQLTSRTDENGFTSETTYDGLGRVLTISVPDPSSGTTTQISSTSYDDSSVPSSATTTTTVDGVSTIGITFWDGLGRVIQTKSSSEDAVYTTVDLWYDELGNVEQETLPYESSSSAYSSRDSTESSNSYTYDPLNRPLTETTPVGTTKHFYYDYAWEEIVTDPNGNSKTYSFDAFGRLFKVQEFEGADSFTTTYDYDPLGNLITLTDAQGNVRNFTYDSFGRKTSQEDLHDALETDFGSWSYGYDRNGNLISQTDPAGQSFSWSYDKLDRPLYEDWNPSDKTRDISFTYDKSTNGKGLPYRIRKGEFTITYDAYDSLGNVEQETRKIGKKSYVFQTEYDFLSRLTRLIYPGSALTVNYAYNTAGLLETVTSEADSTSTQILSDIDYSPLGQMKYMAFGNGATTTNTFDPSEAYRLTSKVTSGIYQTLGSTATWENVQDLSYTYDAVGNITQIVDASVTSTKKTITYTYDDLNRLLSATTSGLSSSSNAGGDYTETYEYDEVGNLTYKSDVGTLLYEGTGSSGANPHAVSSVAGASYSYNDNGNLTSDGVQSFTWNKKNQLENSGNLTFGYDHTGRRYKTVDRSSKKAVYTYYPSPYEEVRDATSTSAGTPTYYIFAGGQRIASYEDSDGDGVEEFYYYHQDHLGGTALATDENGIVVQVYDYYPYGSELINSQRGTTEVHHSFTDKELEDDLGLYYFEARWYDPEIGRFTSQDPAQLDGRVFASISDPQSLNFYAYSRNNPINSIDPTGEEPPPNFSWNPFTWNWNDASYAASRLLEMLPGTGDAADSYGFLTGTTPFSQEPFTNSDRIITTVATAIPLLTTGQVKIVKEILQNYDASNIKSWFKSIGTEGTSVNIRQLSGYTLEDAKALYQSLTKGGTQVTKDGYSGIWTEMSDGTGIGLREASSDLSGGVPTIDIKISGEASNNKIKFE